MNLSFERESWKGDYKTEHQRNYCTKHQMHITEKHARQFIFFPKN